MILFIIGNSIVIGDYMRCLNCNYELENDDNFCPMCGHWTARGYSYFNNSENLKNMMHGYELRQNGKLSVLISLVFLGIVLFIGMLLFRGNNLLKPLIYIKKQFDNYNYGYNVSVMKTDNIYNKISISNIEEANAFIKQDFDRQVWKCMHDIETYRLEKELEEAHAITSVNFCDIKHDEVLKIKQVIDGMYTLFPNVGTGLTNITITNTKSKDDYVAYFQPLLEFVNPGEDINIYNKVNKTQILLNSYYFLNDEILNRDVESYIGNDFYVNGATWESMIAHEFGHYIVFKLFLREKNIDNITFITSSNEATINNTIREYDNGTFASDIVVKALNNYNNKYNLNISINEFTSSISKYANTKNVDGKIIFNETIAEAIHDYYLHRDNCKNESYEIVKIILDRL